MRHSDRGFSLLEIVAVMAILTILALVSLPYFLSAKRKAEAVQVDVDLRTAADEIIAFRHSEGRYPDDRYPNQQPEGVPSFKLLPNTPGESPLDLDSFCIDGKRLVKVGWYGWDRIRQNPVYEASTGGGDDKAVIVTDGMEDCED